MVYTKIFQRYNGQPFNPRYRMYSGLIWKELTSILSNMNNFHSLEVVDRVSETQLQVGENSNWI